MIPVLFPSTASAFNTNGLGRLSDAISCTVTEERNGVYELDMRYPITGAHYSEIDIGTIITARHCDKLDVQPFRVYRITRPLDGIITIYARHISYDLNNIFIKPLTAASITDLFLTKIPANNINTNPFTFWTDKTMNIAFSVGVPSSLRSILGGSEGSVLDVYGPGEYEFDGYTVNFWNHRGADNGVTIRYAKNLTALSQDYNGEGLYNSVAPYWKGADSQGQETVVTLPEGAVSLPGVTNVLITSLDMSEDFQTQPTVSDLRTAATSWLNDHAATTPRENLDVSFVQLWQTNEYKNYAPLQRVALCDTVHIEYAQLGVSATAKVIKVVYDVLLERYDSMELGEPRSSLSSTIISNEQAIQNMQDDKDDQLTQMEAMIQAATDLLAGGLGGHVVINRNANGEPNEILIMDTDDITTAMNVIRMNLNGIGFSTNGYNGPFSTAWTIDGHLNATFITAGILSAIMIQGPTSDTFWDLATGIFQNFGTTQVTAQVETAAGTYTPTTYTLEHKTRIADGALSLKAKKTGGTELPYMDIGLAAEGMDYEFYEDVVGTSRSASYPYAGVDLYGDTVEGLAGVDYQYDGVTATYNPSAHYTPDFIELGGADNLSSGANYYPDRNQLRIGAGWGNHENAIVFKENYRFTETPGGTRRQFRAGIERRPSWEYAEGDNVEYPNSVDSRIICAGYLTDERKTVRFQIPTCRPFASTLTSVDLYGELKIRHEGSYIAGSGSANADFSDYNVTAVPNACGISVKLTKTNNGTWASGNNNHDVVVDIYGLGIIC